MKFCQADIKEQQLPMLKLLKAFGLAHYVAYKHDPPQKNARIITINVLTLLFNHSFAFDLELRINEVLRVQPYTRATVTLRIAIIYNIGEFYEVNEVIFYNRKHFFSLIRFD